MGRAHCWAWSLPPSPHRTRLPPAEVGHTTGGARGDKERDGLGWVGVARGSRVGSRAMRGPLLQGAGAPVRSSKA
eukprot:4971922-Prymnesium_polylepis.1